MRPRLLIPSVLVAVVASVLVDAGSAWAGDGYGQDNYANAQASGGQLTVQADHTYWTPPAHSSWATAGETTPPPGKPNPNQPYGCTYAVLGQSATQLLGVGGLTPGHWVIPTCAGPGAIDPLPPFWVSGATPPAAVVVQTSPVVVARQAVKHLGLSSPQVEMAPPDGSPQLVGVATWLWVDPTGWHPVSASASAGGVTTTATAAPTKVVWDMGDGATVTCDGPGTPYDQADPGGSTACSYTWPAPGSYTVTATAYWSVTWTAVGAPGGGNLGVMAGPPAEVPVTVTQSEAINTVVAGSTVGAGGG